MNFSKLIIIPRAALLAKMACSSPSTNGAPQKDITASPWKSLITPRCSDTDSVIPSKNKFNNLTSSDGSTVHQGDNTTGEGDGDDEEDELNHDHGHIDTNKYSSSLS